jgi:hypothetical protein
METTRTPYTRQNVVVAAVSLLITASYWWLLHCLNAETVRQTRQGYEGEATFLILIPLLLLLMYAGLFSLAAVIRALERGSTPMSNAQLLLGLLPTGLLVVLWMLSVAL